MNSLNWSANFVIDISSKFTFCALAKSSKTSNGPLKFSTFTLNNDDFKESFESMRKEANIVALSGHRSVGGYRASMYNAMEIDSVKLLVEVMSELESKI